jgi:hypothetical protein
MLCATLFKASGQCALSRSPLAGTFLKDTLGDRYCGKNVRPTGIEGQVCEYLRGLRLRQAIIHRPEEQCLMNDDVFCRP